MRSYPETRSGKLLIGRAIFNYRALRLVVILKLYMEIQKG